MWTNKETELLKAQYEHGFTVDESAKIIGKSRLDITNKLMSLGFKPRVEPAAPAAPEQVSIFQDETKQRKRRVTITPEIEKRVCELRREGRNFDSISKISGVSKSSISRILKQNGFDRSKVYENEPAPVAAETSPDLKISTVNNTTKTDFMQEQLKKIKATLETADYSTMAKVGQVIGEAIGRIDTLISMTENTEG
ncbi:MAG: hypothetical protein J6J71_01320 [Prevotella sp.]|nr:hypothetical protein [Prevotella sp.]